MTTNYDTDEDFIDESTDSAPQETPAALRAAAARGAKAKAEADALKRENAFLRAGIDPEDTRLGYFYRGYNGDLTVDAIRSAATESGFLQAAPADPAVAQHQQGQQQVQAASAGTEAAYDPAGAQYALEKAFAEGGVEGMIEVGKQYGLPVATGS